MAETHASKAFTRRHDGMSAAGTCKTSRQALSDMNHETFAGFKVSFSFEEDGDTVRITNEGGSVTVEVSVVPNGLCLFHATRKALRKCYAKDRFK